MTQSTSNSNSVDIWESERPTDTPKIRHLEVMCGNSHMEVSLQFDRPFLGLVFSKGALSIFNCIYVKPQTGKLNFKFDIYYNACGSKPDANGKYIENNIVIQYDEDLIEVWDEAKRLRCEWYNDYERGVTKAPIHVSDLDVVELHFRGDNIDCWMEIQEGKGPWASPVSGIVPLGSTLTMVIGIDDKQGEFDMRVKSCEASDSKARSIELTDENGCVLRPKMLSSFMKMKSPDSRASIVTYAFFHAFKFPDSMAVNIRCKVEICRFGCSDHCGNKQRAEEKNEKEERELDSYVGQTFLKSHHRKFRHAESGRSGLQEKPNVKKVNEETSGGFSGFLEQFKLPYLPSFFGGSSSSKTSEKETRGSEKNVRRHDSEFSRPSSVPVQRTETHGQPLVFPSGFDLADSAVEPIEQIHGGFPYGPRSLNLQAIEKHPYNTHKRIKRQVILRSKRNAELGISSGYDVIGKVDLAFDDSESKNETDSTTTFQGRSNSDQSLSLGGICLPATEFSALFLVLALLTVISVSVSGFICYTRSLQKSKLESAPKPLTKMSFKERFFVQQEKQRQKCKKSQKDEKGLPPPLF